MGPTLESGGSPGVGNGNPLQYSCLENLMDRGAWWATVHGAAESVTAELLTHTHRLSYRVKKGREGEMSRDSPYMWNLKRNYTNELTYKTDSQT